MSAVSSDSAADSAPIEGQRKAQWVTPQLHNLEEDMGKVNGLIGPVEEGLGLPGSITS